MIPTRALIFIGLNFVRFLSIIALLLVFASNIVTIVHDFQAVYRFATGKVETTMDCDYIPGSTVPDQVGGIFFAALNRIFILLQTIVLVVSEVGLLVSFFNRFFPVLGDNFGLGALGIIQALLGAAILSHNVDDFTLVSAMFLFVIGCINALPIGLIFRERAKDKRSVSSWRDQKKSVLPTTANPFASPNTSPTPSLHGGAAALSPATSVSGKAGYGFGRQGEKAAAVGGFLISRPIESLPKYATSGN